MSADWWAKVTGGATVVILALQGVAFMVQARRLKESVNEMRLATQATQDVALAEQQTVDSMKATARRQLRAYVFIETAGVLGGKLYLHFKRTVMERD